MENKIYISNREKRILKLLLSEKKNHEITKELGFDGNTVSFYKRSLLKKTAAKTIIGLYLWNKINKFVEIDEQDFAQVTVGTSKNTKI